MQTKIIGKCKIAINKLNFLIVIVCLMIFSICIKMHIIELHKVENDEYRLLNITNECAEHSCQLANYVMYFYLN